MLVLKRGFSLARGIYPPPGVNALTNDAFLSRIYPVSRMFPQLALKKALAEVWEDAAVHAQSGASKVFGSVYVKYFSTPSGTDYFLLQKKPPFGLPQKPLKKSRSSRVFPKHNIITKPFYNLFIMLLNSDFFH